MDARSHQAPGLLPDEELADLMGTKAGQAPLKNPLLNPLRDIAQGAEMQRLFAELMPSKFEDIAEPEPVQKKEPPVFLSEIMGEMRALLQNWPSMRAWEQDGRELQKALLGKNISLSGDDLIRLQARMESAHDVLRKSSAVHEMVVSLVPKLHQLVADEMDNLVEPMESALQLLNEGKLLPKGKGVSPDKQDVLSRFPDLAEKSLRPLKLGMKHLKPKDFKKCATRIANAPVCGKGIDCSWEVKVDNMLSLYTGIAISPTDGTTATAGWSFSIRFGPAPFAQVGYNFVKKELEKDHKNPLLLDLAIANTFPDGKKVGGNIGFKFTMRKENEPLYPLPIITKWYGSLKYDHKFSDSALPPSTGVRKASFSAGLSLVTLSTELFQTDKQFKPKGVNVKLKPSFSLAFLTAPLGFTGPGSKGFDLAPISFSYKDWNGGGALDIEYAPFEARFNLGFGYKLNPPAKPGSLSVSAMQSCTIGDPRTEELQPEEEDGAVSSQMQGDNNAAAAPPAR